MYKRRYSSAFPGPQGGGGYPKRRMNPQQKGYLQKGYLQTYSRFTKKFNSGPRGLRPELKQFSWEAGRDNDNDYTEGFVLGYNADEALITGPNILSQGPGAAQRIGSRFSIKSLDLKYYFQRGSEEELVVNAANEAEGIRCRIVVLIDKQANGAYPTWNTVFDDTSSTDRTRQEFRVENRDRFQVLYNKVDVLNAIAIAPTATSMFFSGNQIYREKKFRFKTPVVIEMASSEANIVNVKSKNIVVMVASNIHPTDSVGPSVKANTTIRYTDF